MELKGRVRHDPLGAEAKLLVPLNMNSRPVPLKGKTLVQLKAATASKDVLLLAKSKGLISLLGSFRQLISLKAIKTKALRGNTLISNVNLSISDENTKVSYQ